MSVNQPPPEWVVVDASFVLRYVLHTQAKKPHAASTPTGERYPHRPSMR